MVAGKCLVVYSGVVCNTIKGDTMSERLTTDELREMFVDHRRFRTAGVPADYGAEFDEWLHFVRKEAHDEGYELCFADVGDDSR